MAKIVTLGEIILRLSPPGYQRFAKASDFEINYGGAEANVAASLAQFGNDAAFRGQILFTWEFRHTAVRCYNKTDGGVLADDPAGAGFSCLVKGNRLVKPRAFDQPRGVVFFVPKGTIHHISHAVD